MIVYLSEKQMTITPFIGRTNWRLHFRDWFLACHDDLIGFTLVEKRTLFTQVHDSLFHKAKEKNENLNIWFPASSSQSCLEFSVLLWALSPAVSSQSCLELSVMPWALSPALSSQSCLELSVLPWAWVDLAPLWILRVRRCKYLWGYILIDTVRGFPILLRILTHNRIISHNRIRNSG